MEVRVRSSQPWLSQGVEPHESVSSHSLGGTDVAWHEGAGQELVGRGAGMGRIKGLHIFLFEFKIFNI